MPDPTFHDRLNSRENRHALIHAWRSRRRGSAWWYVCERSRYDSGCGDCPSCTLTARLLDGVCNARPPYVVDVPPPPEQGSAGKWRLQRIYDSVKAALSEAGYTPRVAATTPEPTEPDRWADAYLGYPPEPSASPHRILDLAGITREDAEKLARAWVERWPEMATFLQTRPETDDERAMREIATSELYAASDRIARFAREIHSNAFAIENRLPPRPHTREQLARLREFLDAWEKMCWAPEETSEPEPD